MTAPPMVSLLPATPSDVRRLAEIQRLAFAEMAVQRAVFGHVTAEVEDRYTAEHIKKALESETDAVWKAVLQEEGEGRVVGFAVWRMPREESTVVLEQDKVQESEEQKQQRIRARFPEGTNLELAASLFGSLGIATPHLHLSRLATDPSYQRRGVGSLLLKWGCREADRRGVEMYLKSSDVGIPVYQRAGFEFFGDPVGSLTDPALRLYPMTRPLLLITSPSPSELPLIANIHQRAFWPSSFFHSMFHSTRPEDWESWHLARLFRWHASEEKGEGKECTALARRGGRVLGYGHFTVHCNEAGEGEGEEEKGQEWPEGTDVEAARSVFGGMEAVERRIPGRYVVLHQLATDPAHQNTGAGRALLRWFIEKARSMGFEELYLQATPAGLPLYKSMGFKQFAETIVSCRGVEIYPMVHSLKREATV